MKRAATRRERLAHRFERQAAFAHDYSPLYSVLFGLLANWCRGQPNSPLVQWLVEAGNGRSVFDVPLLLLAALHRDVLLGETAVAALAAFYPSVGGKRAPLTAAGEPQPALADELRTAIQVRRNALADFIQTSTVQTNETGRGLAWLLPLLLTGWEAVHLVDLGASAGLNLVAEQRAFRLVREQGSATRDRPADIGLGRPVQFGVRIENWPDQGKPLGARLPRILSRTGCDVQPFHLQTAVDEATLAAFVWADQVARLQRLREGIAAFNAVRGSDTAVRLAKTTLPQQLTGFLETAVPDDSAPLLLYNTYITMYLPQRGAGLRLEMSQWAARQRRPVLWIQWEPAKNFDLSTDGEPAFGWLAWTADYWRAGEHRRWQLGWTHPHGHYVHALPGLRLWQQAMVHGHAR